MKKAIVAGLAACVMFFCLIGATGAATTSGKMYKAIDNNTDQQNYDYDEGTLELTNMKTVNLNKKLNGDISQLKMAVAEYKTVRQKIFTTTHKEVVYYNPDADEVVPESTAAKAPEAKAYSDKYSDVTGDRMHISLIIAILFVLLLGVPFYIIYVWARRHHSVLSYQIENRLFDGVGDDIYH